MDEAAPTPASRTVTDGLGAALRVLVVDDDEAVRTLYRRFLGAQPEYELVGEASDGLAGVAEYDRLRPDVVLMDLQMPRMNGIDATREICGRWPDACVVALTTFGTHEHVVAALQAGAAGYLVKDVGGPGLLEGIRQASAGEMPLSSQVRRELVISVVSEERSAAVSKAGHAGEVELSDRERELLGWLAQGMTNQQIGARMFVSEGSVKQYLNHLGSRLGVTSRTGILIRAIQLDLVDPKALVVEEHPRRV